MKADIVLIKYDEHRVVEDVVVIENKLNTTTSYAQRPKEGFGAIINNKKQTIKVKYTVVGFNHKKNPEVGISKENIYSIHDHGKDDLSNVIIEHINIK